MLSDSQKKRTFKNLRIQFRSGEILRDLREHAQLSKQEMADGLGLPVFEVERWESGFGGLNQFSLRSFFQVLGNRVGDLTPLNLLINEAQEEIRTKNRQNSESGTFEKIVS